MRCWVQEKSPSYTFAYVNAIVLPYIANFMNLYVSTVVLPRIANSMNYLSVIYLLIIRNSFIKPSIYINCIKFREQVGNHRVFPSF